MSRLYIANVTRQEHIVCYRLDIDKDGQMKDSNRRFQMPKQQAVPAGRQVLIGGDMHIGQVTDIVDQLAAYGMIGVVDVARLDGRVHPLVYNIDKPVPSSVMEKVRDSNAILLTRQGGDLRKKAAVATNETVQKAVRDTAMQQGVDITPTDSTDVTFEQDVQTEMGEKRIEEGFHVVPAPNAKPPSRRRKAA